MVNVFSRTLRRCDLAVADGLIVGLGDYDGCETVDVSNKVLAPGFIEGHLHIESSLLTPHELARAVIPHGTTAIIADPHEITNVHGLDGLRYMLDAAEGLPVDIFWALPSCVPATSMETAGADLEAADLLTLADHPKVAGLAEMMNFPGVVSGFRPVMDKLVGFWDRHVDGHSPLLSGKGLNAYVLAGPNTEHEGTLLSEAAEKLDAGMWIMLRQATLARNLNDLLPVVTPGTAKRCMLVCDDIHPDVIMDHGHLDRLIRLAVKGGLDPLLAIELVTYNPAMCFGLKRRGALGPGYRADVVVLKDLESVEVERVYVAGRLAADKGEAVDFPAESVHYSMQSMKLPRITPDKFIIQARGSEAKVIGIEEGRLITQKLISTVTTGDGLVVSDLKNDVLKLAVIERYTGEGGTGLGLVKGFNLEAGALASSVAHDSHNVIVVGVTDEDMALAANEVGAMGGGLVAVKDGAVLARLPLPIAGLMSQKTVAEVRAGLDQVRRAAQDLGCRLEAPFMALSFLALPVMPSLKLTDRGLVDVDRFEFTDLFAEN